MSEGVVGKNCAAFVLVLLVCSLVVSIPNIKPAKASPHVLIAANGTVEGTDLIEQNGDYYTLTADLVCSDNSDGIVVQRDNIVLEGNGFSVIQPDDASGGGIDVSGRTNVTVKDFNIVGFSIGIYIYNINSYEKGNNLIVGNTFTVNDDPGIYLSGAYNNTFYHNNFINNKAEGLAVSNPWLLQGGGENEQNTWDNGSEGNYWSDYSTRYNNSTKLDDSTIWNTPYVINEKNIDRFPVTDAVDIKPVTIPEFPVAVILPLLFGATLLMAVLKKKLHQNR